jgi:hypothetical protein
VDEEQKPRIGQRKIFRFFYPILNRSAAYEFNNVSYTKQALLLDRKTRVSCHISCVRSFGFVSLYKRTKTENDEEGTTHSHKETTYWKALTSLLSSCCWPEEEENRKKNRKGDQSQIEHQSEARHTGGADLVGFFTTDTGSFTTGTTRGKFLFSSLKNCAGSDILSLRQERKEYPIGSHPEGLTNKERGKRENY